MGKFNQSDYITSYTKDNYNRVTLKLRKRENDILEEYCKNLHLSKNALLQKCMIYCFDQMIDISDIKLSSPKD